MIRAALFEMGGANQGFEGATSRLTADKVPA